MKINKKDLKVFSAILVSAVVILINGATNFIYAENKGLNTITIDEYSVTDEQIIPGAEFELSLTLKNNSSKSSGTILVDILNPDGVTPVYGSVTQKCVNAIGAGKTSEVSFKYKASPNLTYEYVDFTVTLSTSTISNTVIVRIPVLTENVIQIVSDTVPENAALNESVVADISFKTIGIDNLDDVVLTASNNGETVGSVTIGTVTAGITKNQGITFALSEEGTQSVDISISYTDSNGEEAVIEVGTYQINVSKDGTSADVDGSAISGTSNVGNTGFIVISISAVLILIIVLVIIKIYKKKR